MVSHVHCPRHLWVGWRGAGRRRDRAGGVGLSSETEGFESVRVVEFGLAPVDLAGHGRGFQMASQAASSVCWVGSRTLGRTCESRRTSAGDRGGTARGVGGIESRGVVEASKWAAAMWQRLLVETLPLKDGLSGSCRCANPPGCEALLVLRPVFPIASTVDCRTGLKTCMRAA